MTELSDDEAPCKPLSIKWYSPDIWVEAFRIKISRVVGGTMKMMAAKVEARE